MICHSACTDHILTIFYLNTCCWLNILQKNHWLFIYFFIFLSFGGVCLAVLSANVKVVGLHLLKLKLQGSRVHSVVRVRLYLNPLAPSWTGAPTHQDSISSSQFTVHLKSDQTPHKSFSRPLEECDKIKLLSKMSQTCENLCKVLDYDQLSAPKIYIKQTRYTLKMLLL